MSYAPIAYTIPQYEDQANWWMKAYEAGTTTPKVMATDSTGATTAAKFEINTAGFPITAGSALVIPFIDGSYDLWLFPTAAEADANTTTNAYLIADGITGVNPLIAGANATQELTVATMTAGTKKVYVAGDVVVTKEFYTGTGGGGTYGVIAGTGTANGFNIIAHDTLSLSFVLRVGGALLSSQMGCVGDGVTNTTAALKAFYNYAIDNNQHSRIIAGTYLIDLGQLAFDNGHISTPFPIIETDGKDLVIFENVADLDLPYLSFTNGTAVSGVGKFWEGGSHDGVTFSRSTGSTANTGQHGLVLNGIDYAKFGFMGAEDIGGHGIYIKRNLFGGTNPDPHHVNGCEFEGIEANRCGGYSFYNDNFVGLSLCNITQIRAIENGGVFYGMGASNHIGSISAGSNAGYLFGDDVAATGGASSRFTVGTYEADDQQYGINANRLIDSDFGTGRFVHRYNFGIRNPSEGYWPLVAVDMGSTSSSNNTFNIIHRVEAGGTKPDIGVFTEFNSTANTVATNIYYKILDNAAFGFTDTDLYQNFSTNSLVKLSRDSGVTIIDTIGDNSALARAPTSYSVPNGGFTTNIVEYSTELKDPAGNYDPATYLYTVREAGLYDVRTQLNLSLTAGNRFRVGVLKNGSAVSGATMYCTVTGVESYFYGYIIDLAVGDTIGITADNNSGSDVALSTPVGANDNYLSINRYK
jgi:hypothetical protein